MLNQIQFVAGLAGHHHHHIMLSMGPLVMFDIVLEHPLTHCRILVKINSGLTLRILCWYFWMPQA